MIQQERLSIVETEGLNLKNLEEHFFPGLGQRRIKWQHFQGGKEMSFSSVQSLSRVRLFVTPWTAAPKASLSITNTWSLLRFMSVESVTDTDFSLLLPPSIFPSIMIFSESVLHIRWPKGWSVSFSISPSSEYSVLISIRID